MGKKADLRKKKKDKLKPRHAVDTSVLMEYALGTKNSKDCENYLTRLGNPYIGCISDLVLGEFMGVAYSKESLRERFEELVRALVVAMKNNDLVVTWFDDKALEVFNGLGQLRDIKDRDKKILACALRDECSQLVTLDRPLIKLGECRIKLDNHTHRINIIDPQTALSY